MDVNLHHIIIEAAYLWFSRQTGICLYDLQINCRQL